LTVRDLLLAAQVTVCAVLVTSSMVAARGLVYSIRGHYGFEPRNVLLLSTVLDMAGYRGDQAVAMQKRMIEALETIPGVDAVASANAQPLSPMVVATNVYTAETAAPGPDNIAARPTTFNVSPNYFRAAGTALLSGRSLTWHDDAHAPRVAVVNREFARRLFGSADGAVGKAFQLRSGGLIQVVGIAEDGKYRSLTEARQPAIFLPAAQSAAGDTALILRADRDPAQLAAAARARLRDLDPALPLYIATWNKELDGALFTARVATVALGVMGLMGAVLAITGIFGMAAYSVSKRLRELGIRMALGAARGEVLQAGLGRVLKLLAFGSAAGLLLGVLSTRIVTAIVYEATPRDPLVLGGAVLVMALLGFAAAAIPARRALSLDPARLLREE
jgi:predicted permease